MKKYINRAGNLSGKGSYPFTFARLNMVEFIKPTNAYPYNIILDVIALIISMTGIILSSLVLSLIFKKRWSNLNIDLKLVSFTLIFDMMSGLLCISNAIANSAENPNYLNSQLFCNIDATIAIFTAATSFNLVGVVGVERCLLVVYDIRLKERYYFILAGGLFLINLASAVISWLDFGFGLAPTGVYCLFNMETRGGQISSILMLFSAAISIGMVYTGYILIVLKRWKRSKKIQSDLGDQVGRIQKQTNSTVFKSLIIIFASTLANIPFCLIIIISLFNPAFFTPLVDTIATTCIMLNQVLNTILVIHMRPDLFAVLKSKFRKKSSQAEGDFPLGSRVSIV